MKLKHISLTLINFLALTAMIVFNYLAVSLPLNGLSTGAISKLYPNLFVPAGFTFSIWGIIYLMLIASIVYQIIALFKNDKRALLAQRLIGLWFGISSLLNVGWLYAWHFRMPILSLFIMIALLLSLIQIYSNLGVGIRQTKHSERFFMHLPFSLYLGWISVATIANFTAVLVNYNWSGWGIPPVFYTSILILVAGLLALAFLQYNVDLFYALPIVWACFGIYYRHAYLEDINQPLISSSTIAVIGLLVFKYLKLRSQAKATRAYW
jgi:benzodiazapine receptor